MPGYPDIVALATQAQEQANRMTASALTSQLRHHLTVAGLDPAEVVQCKVVYDEGSNDFDHDVPQSVEEHNFGTETTPPSGVLTQFWNRADVDKVHAQELLKAAQAAGLA